MRARRLGRLAGLVLALATVVAAVVGASDGATTFDYDWSAVFNTGAGGSSGL